MTKATFRIGFSLFLACAQAATAAWNAAPIPINTSPGSPDVHYNSGGRRLVRIGTTVVALAPTGGGGDQTWRSRDGGATWTQIDTDGEYSGALITGPDSMVYHFYRDWGSTGIHMVRFKIDAASIPAPETIYSSAAVGESGVQDVYRSVNAIVDSAGRLYVAAHWGGTQDRMYVLRSDDGGGTWAGPYQVSADNTRRWYYPHLEVDSRGGLIMTYHEQAGSSEQTLFARSPDRGVTWTNLVVHSKSGSTFYSNPSLLAARGDTLYIFAQGEDGGGGATFVSRSADGGASWGAFNVVERTNCGYGDPSPALGQDGTLYVSYRGSRNTGGTGCGDSFRAKFARSTDKGATWQAVDSFYVSERVGTRSQVRYQSWWNYGGPIEWIWMQYTSSGRPIYYDKNEDVAVFDRLAGGSAPPPGLRIATASLPNGRSDSAYSHTLAASGGSGGYAWRLASGALPPGLSLSAAGALGGTAGAAATYNFTVQAKDGAGDSVSRALSLVILPRNSPPAVDSVKADRTSLTEGDTTRVRAFARDADGDAVTYLWFLDGSGIGSGASVVYRSDFRSSGSRTLEVQVQDSRGGRDTGRTSVVVANRPLPPACFPPVRTLTPDSAVRWGWPDGSRDPDLDTASLRFTIEGFADSGLTRLAGRRDSVAGLSARIGTLAAGLNGRMWLRVRAFDSKGYQTGFGKAVSFTVSSPTSVGPASVPAPGMWQASLSEPGGGGAALRLFVPGSGFRGASLELLGQDGRRKRVFRGDLASGWQTFPLEAGSLPAGGVWHCRVSAQGSTFVIRASLTPR